ncbi:HicB family protein [Halobacteriales archaeon QS_4_62_28]|nr:MAG: HicB family protein [Halobacteriales archaeon QS_4_62_28]
MANSTGDMNDRGEEIRMWREDDWRVITHVGTGVRTYGDSREHALEMIDDAVALYRGEASHEPTDEELRELGVDPETARSQGGELPDVLK